MANTKYIFVTGGVVSGLGKGITAASLGRLLKARGFKVTIQKFDPYINIDPGTMSPYQHGEVFVTDDGGETDLDVGHYERFIDENLNSNSNITAGKVYWSVLNKERMGEYLGATIQVIPHITNDIKERIFRAAKNTSSDIVITEIGGTVGDIEGLPFFEAIRQVSKDVGKENTLYIHVTLVPYLKKSGELKTKPTQHSVKEILSIGIQPDIVVCRTENKINSDTKEKLALFCNVEANCIIENMDLESLYDVPLFLENEKFAQIVSRKLKLEQREPDLTDWIDLVNRQKSINNSVTIALVGKYVELYDAYLSVVESLNHAGIHNDTSINIKWISAETLEKQNPNEVFKDVDGILIPGGFGDRGVEGKITAANYARVNKIPFFGICLGMQCAIIEYSRNVLGYKDANSTEFDHNTKYPVIDIMPDQLEFTKMGGTSRLGAYPCKLIDNTLAKNIYGEVVIYERHRHRFEVNNAFRESFSNNSLVISGISPNDKLVEIVELKESEHPFFIGVQFHPEFKSRPNRPHPLFKSFIKKVLELKSE